LAWQNVKILFILRILFILKILFILIQTDYNLSA
jgi:hypothetical protein